MHLIDRLMNAGRSQMKIKNFSDSLNILASMKSEEEFDPFGGFTEKRVCIAKLRHLFFRIACKTNTLNDLGSERV